MEIEELGIVVRRGGRGGCFFDASAPASHAPGCKSAGESSADSSPADLHSGHGYSGRLRFPAKQPPRPPRLPAICWQFCVVCLR